MKLLKDSPPVSIQRKSANRKLSFVDIVAGDPFLSWCLYLFVTERFDRMVCTGRSPRTGNAMPETPHQQRLSSRFAIMLRQQLRLEYGEPAKYQALQYSYDGLAIVLREAGVEVGS